MENVILQTENITTGYDKKIVSENILIQLKAGQLITLIGVNGVGKSTLLRSITGIIPVISGNVSLNNRSIANYSTLELAQQISVVLTDKLPPSNLTVYELVALGRQPYTNWLGNLASEDLEKIDWAINLTEINVLKHKKHYELSDGQLQKVLIARALAQDTPLIVLDEPTTHLDLVHKVSVYKLLQKLAKQTNKCILVSTHDVDLALQMSNEVLVLTEEKLYQNTPQKLIASSILEQIFIHDDIYFDKEKAKFIIK
ncbi:ABC transporter ATP-binding protein [Flavobacterium agricola]|uniref:ABC transporter ATP-binding protein n=1 Tax=Flavobacterium agricola TaxID=2870839 RepID=A0ABY6LWD8_9FLAO|nr:ABC transporter ATP-binding protein [Flavobacterium agricola]UYW00481.1 ABC transporter ATP-binding protein [Flavobacterium agricola]